MDSKRRAGPRAGVEEESWAAQTLVLLLVELKVGVGPIRVCPRHSFLYKGKHTRSFYTSFWRAKEVIRIYFFLMMIEAFLLPVEKDLLLLKKQQGGRRRHPHVSTEAGAHDRRLRGPSTQASTSSSLDLCSSNKVQFFLH